jgi:hypothetical protein
MTSRGKQLFIFFTVIMPFLIYCIIYYAPMIRNAPFKAKEFVSFEYRWGAGKNLENSYNSATGEYRYYNNNDSLVVKKVVMDKKEFKFLDSVADVQGFWNLPKVVANDEEDLEKSKALRYFMKFNYQKKSKEVTYLSDYNGEEKMRGAAAQMQKVIEQSINEAEAKQSK